MVTDLERHAEAILSRALSNGGDWAEIYVEERASSSIGFDDNRTERILSGVEAGAGIRVLLGDRTLFAHTNDLSLDGLLQLAATVAAGATGRRGDACFEFHPERAETTPRRDTRGVPMEEKLRLVAEVNAAVRAFDPRIAQASIRYADAHRRFTVVNSLGRFVEDARPQTLLVIQVVAADKGLLQTGYRVAAASAGYELFDAEDPIALAREAAAQACLMLEAAPAPAGRMPVVLSSAAGGTMVHEAVGHGLEADAIDKGLSKYAGRLGEMVAAPEVSVVDDATLGGKRGSFHFDDEGTPAQRTVLIENGRLVRYMNDLKTSRKLSYAPTGNGRRESYGHLPIPRMTNTMILPGAADPETILRETHSGLFVKKMGGGQVNPLNGDFVFEVSEGYLIRNGKAETPVRGATLIGNGPDAMCAIEAIGNDLGFGVGTCGKKGQGAPVTHAQPTLRIRELTVGGTA